MAAATAAAAAVAAAAAIANHLALSMCRQTPEDAGNKVTDHRLINLNFMRFFLVLSQFLKFIFTTGL